MPAKHPAVQVVRQCSAAAQTPAAGRRRAPSRRALWPCAGLLPLARPCSARWRGRCPGAFEPAPTAAASPADIAAVKQVIEAARKGKEADADAAEASISDPVARKLAEWVILRSDNTKPSFERYAAFVTANPSWPHAPLFRRRAENALWNDDVDDAAVLAFFANHKPRTAKGRYMLARVLLAKGDREGAAALVRYAWRHEDCSADVESKVLEMFGSMLTRADHKARMEQRFYADDVEAGMRAANRLGGDDLAIGRARAAVIKRLNNAKALLDAVPASARARSRLHLRARAMAAPKQQAGRSRQADPHRAAGPGRAGRSRSVVAGAAHPGAQAARRRRPADRLSGRARRRPAAARGFYRVDHYFTAGWIALRFLHDPKTAAAHFAHISEGTVSPYALARGGYWQGRAAEAMGQRAQAKAYYETAAQYTATYYGQIARARLGLTDLGLRGPPSFTPAERGMMGNLEVVRAAEILYALNERDMLASIYAELGESGTDVAGLAALGRSRRQAWRRPRHAAARRWRLCARPAARILRLSDRRPARLQADRAADRAAPWPIRSRARKATSTRRSSRPPMPWG